MSDVKKRKVKTDSSQVKKSDYLDNDYCDNRLEEVKKPYVQFSKKMIAFLIINLLVIEAFVMYMIFITKDTSTMPYLITGIAATIVTSFVWYFKNSEAEKRARIDAEVERMKLQGKVPIEAFDKALSDIGDKIEAEPETYYKEDSNSYSSAPEVIRTPVKSFDEDDGSVG